jgi:hypothetical protein
MTALDCRPDFLVGTAFKTSVTAETYHQGVTMTTDVLAGSTLDSLDELRAIDQAASAQPVGAR